MGHVAHARAKCAGFAEGSKGCDVVSRGVLCPTAARWQLPSYPASLLLDPWTCHKITAVGTYQGGSAGDAQAARSSEGKSCQGRAAARLHSVGSLFNRVACVLENSMHFSASLQCKVKRR